MIADLKRYIIASLNRVIEPVVAAEDYNFWIEGIDFDESEVLNSDNAVLRVLGPDLYPRSGKQHYKVEVIVLVTDLLDYSSNSYELTNTVGKIAATLENPVPVNEWGDGDAFLGCLDVDPGARQFLRIVDFGVIQKDTRVKQMAVMVKYHIDLDS